jgi:hypothetical protein
MRTVGSHWALILRELLAKTLLRIGCLLERRERDLELPPAIGAHVDGGDRTEPFCYTEVAYCHG